MGVKHLNKGATRGPFEEARFELPAEGEDPGTSILGTLRLLRRRWRVLAATCLVTAGLAFAFGITRSPTYLSEATIEVGPDQPLVPHDPIADASARSSHLWENHFRTQETLLRSPGLISGLLESLPPDRVTKYRLSPDPIKALSEDLSIVAVPSTFLIRISLDHERPENGPEIVNKLVALFMEGSHRRIRDLRAGALFALSTESLPVIRQKVADAERALKVFGEERGFGASEDRYASLLEAAKKVGERRLEVRMRAIALRSTPAPRAEDLVEPAGGPTADPDRPGSRASSLPALEAERTTIELELARQTVMLKDRHPTILALRNQLDVVMSLIMAAGRAATERRDRAVELEAGKRERALEAAALEERSLDEEEKRLNGLIADAHGQVRRRQELEAEVAASRDLLNSYLKRHGEFEATSGAGLASVRIVDLAREPRTVQPKRALFLSLGVVAGLVLGAFAILLVDQVDDRIMSPQQAEASLALDVLGTVPRLPRAPGPVHMPCFPEDDGSSEPLEPFRRLRTEIATRLEEIPGGRLLAVVSGEYDEGRSTVAVNLARALALEGRKVLLFDADLREPGLRTFIANRRAPGLEDHLAGGVSLEDCIHPSRILGVHVLAPKVRIEGSAEIAGSPRFRDLWRVLKARFDWIVVDTSPVEAASEAAVIAGDADASILVVQEGRTRLREAARARRRLENHRVRVLGLVVNESHLDSPSKFEGTRACLKIDRISGEKNAFLEVG